MKWSQTGDAVRNTIVRWQARALMLLVVLLAFLLLAGFGHEVVWYLFDKETGSLWGALERAGGWIALLTAALSTAFTLVKAFPSPRGHDAFTQEPSRLTKIVMTITPILAVVALGVACAWVGQAIFISKSDWPRDGYIDSSNAIRAMFVSAVLLTAIAMVESMSELARRRTWLEARRPFLLALSVLVLYGLALARWPVHSSDPLRTLSYATIALAAAALVWQWSDDPATAGGKRLVMAAGAIVPLIVLVFVRGFRFEPGSAPASWLYWLAIGLFCFITVWLLVRWVEYGRMNRRAVVLAALAMVESGTLVLFHHLPHHDSSIVLRTTGMGWAGFFIAWVVALGWTIDPNLLSLNNFYKARIVRAYLGASNKKRRGREISESAPDDDLPLASLRNHEIGAPLHLVNATLNLVGGRELASAQRSASSFTMSSRLCGSPRTGYRRTETYMDGTLSLGSAVAASGAAVSPTMGTKSVSAPLALLLALFNIRLGFWAPTPNRDLWKAHQPTLWPFYLSVVGGVLADE